ncbi:MAG TPA: hypothetical protein VFM48_06880 [Aquabacterium sp.]|nr:hypothetical protein [Aquabacterium sp.]
MPRGARQWKRKKQAESSHIAQSLIGQTRGTDDDQLIGTMYAMRRSVCSCLLRLNRIVDVPLAPWASRAAPC